MAVTSNHSAAQYSRKLYLALFTALVLRIFFSLDLLNSGLPDIFLSTQYPIIFAADVFIVFFGIRRAVSGAFSPLLVLLAITYGYVAASAIWSSELLFASARSAAFLLSSLSAFAIGRVLGMQAVWRATLFATAAAIVLSVMLIVLTPEVGIDQSWRHSGKWTGVFDHKNQLGRVAALAAILSAWSWANRVDGRRLTGALFLVSVVVVIGSNSRTALIMLLVGLMAVAAFDLRRRGLVVLISIVVVGAFALGTIVTGNLPFAEDEVLAARETELLGPRFQIWGFALDRIAEAPVFGFGMGGFWNERTEFEFYSSTGWVIPNFHNGFVQTLVEFGVVGSLLNMALLACVLIATTRRKFRRPSSNGGMRFQSTGFDILFLVLFVLVNLSETLSFRSTNVWQYLFTAVVAAAATTHPIHFAAHRLPYPQAR